MSEWIEWNGGRSCPVGDNVMIEVMRRDGHILNGPGGSFPRWEDDPELPQCDFIAYRLLEQNP